MSEEKIENNQTNSIIIGSLIFHKSFVDNYRGMTKIQARRKLKKHYTRSPQNQIIRYLSENKILIQYASKN